jgi:hypothetical protein
MCIINTHPPIFILFGYKDWISEPIWVVHFFNKTSIYQSSHFFLYHIFFVLGEMVESLLDGLGLQVEM